MILVLPARASTTAFASAATASRTTPTTAAFAWNHGAGLVDYQRAAH